MQSLKSHFQTPTVIPAVLMLVLMGSVPWALGQTDEPDSAGMDVTAPPETMGSVDRPDTVRTNLWLTEALMGEIVLEAAQGLPAAPGSIMLEEKSDTDGNSLFRTVAANRFLEAGYEVFLAVDDSLGTANPDYLFRFDVVKVQLQYPEVGRTLGIWRRWVGRDLGVVASIEITEFATSRLILSERYTRNFSDRVDSEYFDTVQSDLYPFTSAQTKPSGWGRRAEEIVILGSLVGLIAVYFANTGN